MNIPQIRIDQTFAKIGLNIQQPVQKLRQIPAELHHTTTPAKMQVEKQPGKLEIDQQGARDNMKMKKPSVFSAENAERAKQEWYQGLAERVEEGNRLAAIENKVNAITEIETDKALAPLPGLQMAYTPTLDAVKLSYQPSKVDIHWEIGGTKIDVKLGGAEHDYTPGKTEVYLRQRQRLNIDFIGLNIDRLS